MSTFDAAQSAYDNATPDDEDDVASSKRGRRGLKQWQEDHADEIIESRSEARDEAKEWGGIDQ